MTTSVLDLINDKQAIDLVLPLALTFAKARETLDWFDRFPMP
jgi:hypothetical protein